MGGAVNRSVFLQGTALMKAMKMAENDLDLDFPPKSGPQEPDGAIPLNNHTGV